MDTEFSIDVNEGIWLKTELFPTVEELCTLVCKNPGQIDDTLEKLLPQLRRFTENNFGCTIELSTCFTIEGHTSVEVKIKHFSQTEEVGLALSLLQKDDIVPLMKCTIQTLAALLPLPYSVCSHCKSKHKRLKCPLIAQ